MRRLAAIAVLTVLGALIAPTPAQAAVYLEVCNSSASITGIRPYDRNQGWTNGGRTLQPGECWSFYNANDQVRIDIDVANRGVGSWKWGLYNQGYGACKEYYSGEHANPADAWNGTRLTIRNYWNNHCS